MTNQTLTLYMDSVGHELFVGDKKFYAESCILNSVDTDVYEVEVESSVRLQIKLDKDGLKLYEVLPVQVLKIQKLEF